MTLRTKTFHIRRSTVYNRVIIGKHRRKTNDRRKVHVHSPRRTEKPNVVVNVKQFMNRQRTGYKRLTAVHFRGPSYICHCCVSLFRVTFPSSVVIMTNPTSLINFHRCPIHTEIPMIGKRQNLLYGKVGY